MSEWKDIESAPIAQAFARHRIASSPIAGVDREVIARDELRSKIKDLINAHVMECMPAGTISVPRHPGPTADAILALKGTDK